MSNSLVARASGRRHEVVNALNSNVHTQKERAGSATELSPLIEYETFCGRAEGKSDRTIELTELALGKLVGFLRREGLPTDAGMIGPDEIRALILDLKASKRFANHPYVKSQADTISDHSINTYLRAVRAPFNHWVEEGLLSISPFKGVKLPRLPEKVKPPLSAGELKALHNSVDQSSPQGPRDAALLAVLTDTVSRVTEAIEAPMQDLDLKGRHLKVLGKGRRERLIPFGVKTQKLLYKYVHFHRPPPSNPREDRIFLTHDGRPLTRHRAYAIVRKYARKAGIDRVPCSPHSLRRSGCVRWIVNGGDIYSLQKMTGHKSLTVLRSYVELSQDDVKSLHEKYSPMDNL